MARYNDNSGIGWKIFSLFLMLVIVAGVITGVVFWQKGNIVFNPVEQEQPNDEDETPDDGQDEDDGGAVIVEGASNGINLMNARIAPENYAEQGISPLAATAYLLTAIITPEDAVNKAVDWTIAWQNPDGEFAVGKTVTDYVTVTPTADGALTANVECLQPFSDFIDITVTTRDGGLSAVCTVVFEGKPSSLSITSSDVSLSGDYYNLGVGSLSQNYVFDLNLSNEWNQVGDKFYDFTFEVKGYGDFVAQDKRKDSYNSEYYWTGEETTIQVSEWADTFLEVSVTSDKKMNVRAKKTVKNFGSEQVIAGGGRLVTNAYKSGGENVYFEITAKTASGLSQTIKVKLVSSVDNITIDTLSIVF